LSNMIENVKKWFFKKFVVKRMYNVKSFLHKKKLYTFDKVERKITAGVGQVFAEDIIMQIYSTFIVRYKWWEMVIEWLRHNLAVYISDPIYYSVSENDLNNINKTKDYVYNIDVFDCDDFAFLTFNSLYEIRFQKCATPNTILLDCQRKVCMMHQ